jgi:hypothetical protein
MSNIRLTMSVEDAKNLSEHLRKNFNLVSERLKNQLDTKIARLWDENHDQNAKCECGHVYHRHFDSWEDMEPIGCKYCQCDTFKEVSK